MSKLLSRSWPACFSSILETSTDLADPFSDVNLVVIMIAPWSVRGRYLSRLKSLLASRSTLSYIMSHLSFSRIENHLRAVSAIESGVRGFWFGRPAVPAGQICQIRSRADDMLSNIVAGLAPFRKKTDEKWSL